MAKRAFDHCSHDYARYRPTYPPEVAKLVHNEAPPGSVADVGAGTGIFTRALAKTGRRTIAIDPSHSMLAHIADDDALGIVERVAASAELVPLATASVAAVTCAQSFHWFNPPIALAEFARILAPGGLLLLVWNSRDAAHPFVRDFEELVAKWNPAYRREYRTQDWASKIATAGGFTPAQALDLASTWALTIDEFIGFTRSVSYIRNAIPKIDLPDFEGEVRELAELHYPDGNCRIPLRTTAWWCRRLS